MSRKKRQNIPTNFHAETEAEALFLEQAQAYFRDLQKTANNAPDGKVLEQVEDLVLLKSRKLVQQSMELSIQEQIDQLEKKKKPRSVRNAKRKKGIKAIETKTF